MDGSTIPVFVISLSTAKERRRHVQKQLDNAGLNYTLVDAVNGKDLTSKEIASLCDMEAVNKHPEWLSPGAIGCALSHLNVFKKIVKENFQWTLVLEDDIILAENFREHLDVILNRVTSENVIMLYYQSWEPLRLSNYKKIQYLTEYGLYFPVDIRQVITTGAYLISHDAAERMAGNILPVRVSADSWGWFFAKGIVQSMRCAYPRIVEIAPFKSSIDYFDSTAVSKITGVINRMRFPVIFQLLRQRRLKSYKKRQLVQITDQLPQWQEN